MLTTWYLTNRADWLVRAMAGKGPLFRKPRHARPRAATGRVLAVCPGKRHVWVEALAVPGGRVRKPLMAKEG